MSQTALRGNQVRTVELLRYFKFSVSTAHCMISTSSENTLDFLLKDFHCSPLFIVQLSELATNTLQFHAFTVSGQLKFLMGVATSPEIIF